MASATRKKIEVRHEASALVAHTAPAISITSIFAGRRKALTAMALLGLVALTVWLWSPALGFGFIYDDHAQIELNPWIQSWGHLGKLLREHLWAQLGPERASPWYRPLFAFLLLVQYTIFGTNAQLWHLANIGLHTAVVLTLFSFLLLQFRRLLPAFGGACLFACSPLTSEVVNWVSAADEALYTLFTLLAFCALALCAQTDNARRAILLQCCSAGLLTLAILSKETAIVSVLLALCYTCLLSRSGRRHYASLIAYLVPVLAFLVTHLALHSPDARSFSHSLQAMLGAALLAFRKLIWSLPVSEFYDLWIDQTYALRFIFLGVGILVLIGIACWLLARRSRFAAWSLLVMILPVAACVGGVLLFRDYDLFHDRYLYLPVAGCAMLLGAAVAWVEAHSRFLQPFLVLIAVVLCLEMWQSRNVSDQFCSDLSFYEHAAQVAPRNIVALQLLAAAKIRAGDCSSAIGDYQHAEQLRPDLWKTSFFLGTGYLRCNLSTAAEDAFVRATKAPGVTTEQAALAWYELGHLRLVRHDLAGAEVSLNQAAIRDPGSWKIRSLLIQVRSQEKSQ